jgi:hypothetical protein
MFKIKSGELKPETGFVASRSAGQEEKVSTEPLASLGIEFEQVVSKGRNNVDNSSNKNKQNNFIPKTQNYSKPNNNINNKPQFVEKKKYSGPSPLLRGLLEKITSNGKNESEKNGFKVEEKVLPKQEPISLSELKKQDKDNSKITNILPSKRASDEKKSSLKDVVSRINIINKNPEIKKEEPVVVPIVKKEEPVLVPMVKKEEPIIVIPENKIEEKKEEIIIPKIVEQKLEPVKEVTPIPKVEEKIEPIKKVEEVPVVKNEEPKKEEDKNSSWQKRKVKKEVPEDVLRKVLE